MAAEELADIERLDAKLKAMTAELAAVLASGSRLMDIHGIGPRRDPGDRLRAAGAPGTVCHQNTAQACGH